MEIDLGHQVLALAREVAVLAREIGALRKEIVELSHPMVFYYPQGDPEALANIKRACKKMLREKPRVIAIPRESGITAQVAFHGAVDMAAPERSFGVFDHAGNYIGGGGGGEGTAGASGGNGSPASMGIGYGGGGGGSAGNDLSSGSGFGYASGASHGEPIKAGDEAGPGAYAITAQAIPVTSDGKIVGKAQVNGDRATLELAPEAADRLAAQIDPHGTWGKSAGKDIARTCAAAVPVEPKPEGDTMGAIRRGAQIIKEAGPSWQQVEDQKDRAEVVSAIELAIDRDGTLQRVTVKKSDTRQALEYDLRRILKAGDGSELDRLIRVESDPVLTEALAEANAGRIENAHRLLGLEA